MLKMPFPFSVILPFPAQFAVVPANQAYLSHAPDILGKIFVAFSAIVLSPLTDGTALAKDLGIFAVSIIGGAIISTF